MRNDREVKIKHTSIIYNQKLHQVDIDRDTDYTIIGSRAGVKRQGDLRHWSKGPSALLSKRCSTSTSAFDI